MPAGIEKWRTAAREAAGRGDWGRVADCARAIRRLEPGNPDGPFLDGLVARARGENARAADLLQQAMHLDPQRYDIAVELATTLVAAHRYAEARTLLEAHREALWSSPRYLDQAGSLYTTMNRHDAARELFARANALQPQVAAIELHLATSEVYLGAIDAARDIYRRLLEREPAHQRAHYELAQLAPAADRDHVEQMEEVLRAGPRDPSRNIYLYYALGKELEDLGDWDAAFAYYERAGQAVKSVSRYDVRADVELIDTIIDTCSADWLAAPQPAADVSTPTHTPVFIVGLPRTGTTLVERILSSHSRVQSVGETQLLQMVLREGTRANNAIGITPAQIRAASKRPPADIAGAYLDALAYRLGPEPLFTEKLPENILYLGFIARSWPGAPLVHVRRHPMDACFAMFKQSYFRFAYTLEDVADYYLAYDRLARHWRELLGEHVLEVAYEDLVTDVEAGTRRLLAHAGLDFEAACLEFAANTTPVATASAVQVRSGVHTRSVGRWRKFERQLEPLRRRLADAGVAV